jgi:glycosyltransferase involved in cell wall biosynthesis
MGKISPRIEKLAGRSTAGIPPALVVATDRSTWQKALHMNVSTAPYFAAQGTRGAKALYAMWGTEPAFIDYCKAAGLKIVLDLFIHPYSSQREDEEYCRHSWLRARPSKWDQMKPYFQERLAVADFILCPCQDVAEGVSMLVPSAAKRIRIIPFASSIPIAATIPNPRCKRVLFVGTDIVRKGLVYLAEAARLLKRIDPEIEIVVAGLRADEALGMPNAESLRFLGRLPLDRIHEEYQNAQVFVLPSLAEGQAGVVLEALASGCPVIATRASGVDFEDGESGFFVPIRDPDALASAINRVLSDAQLRAKLARNGLELAADAYSFGTWKAKLADFVRNDLHIVPRE